MKPTVICLCSAKGGTGKTAIAGSIGALLADMGKKVLLIDADAATNGMTMLMLKNLASAIGGEREEGEEEEKVAGFFDEGRPRSFEVADRLVFVPASGSMRGAGVAVYHDNVGPRLSYVLERLGSEADMVIVDAEAGTEARALTVIGEADIAIIVSEFDPMSATGVERMREAFAGAWPIDRTYILVNKILPEFAKIESEYFLAWRHLPPIPFDFAVMRSYARGQIPLDTERPNSFTRGLLRVVKSVLPEYEDDVDAWLESKVSELREPYTEKLVGVNVRIRKLQERLVQARVLAEEAGERASVVGSLFDTPFIRVRGLFPVVAGLYLLIGAGIFFLADMGGLVVPVIFATLGAVSLAGWAITRLPLPGQRPRAEDEVWRRREERERILLEVGEIEQSLQRLLNQKNELETLLSTEPEEFIERGRV